MGASGAKGTTGTPGAIGPTGPTGIGVDGDNGANGHDALVEITQLGTDIGDECGIGGGVQIDTGTDADNSGLLNDAEFEDPLYVCNGLNSGHNLLVETSVEPAGDNCENGGVAILIGTDLDDDMLLQVGEYTDTQYACNGDPGARGEQGDDGAKGATGAAGPKGPEGPNGHNSLSRTASVDVGSTECPTGGAIAATGVDDNDNGVLDDNEVDDSQTVCNGDDGVEQVFAFEPIEKGGECGEDTTGVNVRSGLDNGDGTGIADDGILQDAEVDRERALCVEGANITSTDSGCGVTAPRGGTNPSNQTALWLLGAGGVLLLRRRRRTMR